MSCFFKIRCDPNSTSLDQVADRFCTNAKIKSLTTSVPEGCTWTRWLVEATESDRIRTAQRFLSWAVHPSNLWGLIMWAVTNIWKPRCSHFQYLALAALWGLWRMSKLGTSSILWFRSAKPSFLRITERLFFAALCQFWIAETVETCGNSESNPSKPKQLHEFLHGRKFFQSQNSWQRRPGIALSPADLKRCWNPTCYENNCHHQTYGISVSTIMCI